jgi:hypothetical protein
MTAVERSRGFARGIVLRARRTRDNGVSGRSLLLAESSTKLVDVVSDSREQLRTDTPNLGDDGVTPDAVVSTFSHRSLP